VTKQEFLNLLEQRLMVLNDEERADLLSEYEQHIKMKVQSGLSEEEAIADFGDPEELIRELLEAYHLNTTYQQKNPYTTKLIYYAKNCAHFLSSIFESLCQMRKRTLLQLFLRACAMLLFLGVLFCSGALFCSMLRSFLVYTLPFGGSIGRAFYALIELCLYIVYMAFSIYLIIFFIKRYVLIDYQPLKAPTLAHNPDADLDFSLNETKKHTNDIFNQILDKAAQSHERRQQVREQRLENGKESFHIPFPDISLTEMCIKVVLLCCRFIGFFFLLFAACSALGLIAGAATALVFVAMGYSIIGPFLVVLGCALLAIVVTLLLFQFVFQIKGGAKA